MHPSAVTTRGGPAAGIAVAGEALLGRIVRGPGGIDPLLGAETAGVLLRSFVIAVVLMAPVALWQWSRIRRRRGRQRSASYQTAADLAAMTSGTDDGPSLEAVVAEINRVASTLPRSANTVIEVPPHLTVGRSPADTAVVEAVLRDSIARSGLEVVGTDSDGDTVRLHCTRR